MSNIKDVHDARYVVREWRLASDKSDARYEVEVNELPEGTLSCNRYRYRVRDPLAAFGGKPRPWWSGLPDTIHAAVTETHTGFPFAWGAANPELFVDSMRRFVEEHPFTEWVHFQKLTDIGLEVIARRKDAR
jgi:hypothetical protein